MENGNEKKKSGHGLRWVVVFLVTTPWMVALLRGDHVFQHILEPVCERFSFLCWGEYHYWLAWLFILPLFLLSAVMMYGEYLANEKMGFWKLIYENAKVSIKDFRFILYSLAAVLLSIYLSDLLRGEKLYGRDPHDLHWYVVIAIIGAGLLFYFIKTVPGIPRKKLPIRRVADMRPTPGHKVVVFNVSKKPNIVILRNEDPQVDCASIIKRVDPVAVGGGSGENETLKHFEEIRIAGVSIGNDIMDVANGIDGQGESSTKFNWLQLLRGLLPHAKTVKQVCLVPSRESIRYVSECGHLLRPYLSAPGASLDCLVKRRNDAGNTVFALVAPDVAQSNQSQYSALDEEDVEELVEGYSWYIREGCQGGNNNFSKNEIIIDVTGGMRQATIAGAIVTLNNEARFQYVKPVEVLDACAARSTPGDKTSGSGLCEDVLAYDYKGTFHEVI